MTVADPRVTARLGLFESYRKLERSDWIEATGRSMHPSIPPGSRLLVDFGRGALRQGEVLVFRRGDALIAHRLVGWRHTTEGLRLYARGDGEAFIDPVLTERDVLGVVRVVTLPDGRSEDLDAAWRRETAIAIVSWWSGRAAGIASRAARRAPAPSPLRRAALASLVGLSRVPTRVVSHALPRSTREPVGERR
jgi:peptidase S24-like protein